MQTSDFDYELPQELIAQEPPAERGTSRMMVLHRSSGVFEHRRVSDLPEYLTADDLLVLNDTRVFPARIQGTWLDTHGSLELLLVEPLPDPHPGASEAGERCCWACITGSGRPVRVGQKATFAEGQLEAEIISRNGNGTWTVLFRSSSPLMEVLEQYGLTPVPPYIHRHGDARQARLDRERYQTIFARETGAVAAPTAGLHFSPSIFAALEAKGVQRSTVTLHVGPGTFKPVKSDTVEAHVMDPERYRLSADTAAAVAACRLRGGRVVAVGSTSVRTLETVASANGGEIVADSGTSSIFIHPPYRFQATDAMLTNFHLPKSTLIMMVSALAGHAFIMAAYREAIRSRYLFFSYGDCMLIL
jgi:S-adenosylmethionine:tRNA ribosyltransferase-isomerase